MGGDLNGDPHPRGSPFLNGDPRILQTRLKDIALNSFQNYLNPNNSASKLSALPRPEFHAIKSLSKLKDIIIQKSDKGNSVVIMDKVDYIRKMDEILKDTSKFQLFVPPFCAPLRNFFTHGYLR